MAGKKSVSSVSIDSVPLWRQLGVSSRLTAGRKAAIVRSARNGVRPNHLSPQKWAWHSLNPNGRSV